MRKGLARVNFHALRHSFATLTFAGNDLKHTSVALEHAGVGITGRIYAHVTEAVQEEAAAKLDNLLGRRDDATAQKLPNSGSAG
ncbi:MAG: hypothetical protein ACREMT_01560 [Vulcanimicrobiaceae bacterium]